MSTPKYDRDNLVNLLAERAAFERSAVTLYDVLLRALEGTDEPLLAASMDALRRHRDEEREHAEWVERLLARLGGRPRRDLPDAAMHEARANEEVIERAHESGSVLAMFHAMLAAELMDGEGWKLLLEVADDLGDRAAIAELRTRVAREDEHLALIRHLVLTLTKRSVSLDWAAERMRGDGARRPQGRRGPGLARARTPRARHEGRTGARRHA